MSVQNNVRRITAPDIRARKGGDKLVCLTAYTAQVAHYLNPHVDLLLVGDSLAMVLYGMENTLAVSLDTMIRHGKAVVKSAPAPCVIVDLPFGSYQESPEQAFRNAARVMQETGCSGVKLEGGAEMAATVRFMAERGIPVLGHVGLTPQHVMSLGGFKAQGRSAASARKVRDDARAIAAAGAFALVVEGTMEDLARELTAELDIPTIGIGASPACDGQILVTEDILGLFADFTPRFVKRYAQLGDAIADAGARYAAEVRGGAFPAAEHCFGVSPKKAPRKGGKKGNVQKASGTAKTVRKSGR